MHILVSPTDILCPCPLDEKNGDRNDDEPVDLHNTNFYYVRAGLNKTTHKSSHS